MLSRSTTTDTENNLARSLVSNLSGSEPIKNVIKRTNERKGPRTKMLLVYVGATDSSHQPKIKYKDNKLQG